MSQPFSCVRVGKRGDVHFTADGIRALCNLSLTTTWDWKTETSQANPEYFHPSPCAVSCMLCIDHLQAARTSSEAERARRIAQYERTSAKTEAV